MLRKVRVARIRAGRPRVRPDRVRADKAYGSRKNRAYLRRRGIRCTIPEKKDQVRNRKEARLPRGPAADVRQGRLPREARGRMRDQSPQAPPGRGHEVRQTRRPLLSNRAGRGHQ
ncbi:transposase [Planotetraspora silvatica]|uniref:transposase n=1 Tax=Planotetraspora silvatica TaxID=234614 RepID=UPI001EF18CBB|nr:transposase [Planotetraspora silvatica]